MKILAIKVKPNSRRSELTKLQDGKIWTTRIIAPPVNVKANHNLIYLVAKHFPAVKRM
jgi:uncharacterized protein YggU (UPF0235/DUF167 family)